MYLDLMDVLRAPGTAVERALDIAPTTLDDVELVEPVRGTIRAVNARQNIVVTGRAATAVQMRCARCLRSYAQPLELELEASAPLSFFRALAGDEVEIDAGDEADDEVAAIFDAHMVDVLELVRQAVVLQSPIQPLCAPDCPGLPEAAQYREVEDERWSALKQWSQSATRNGKQNESDPDESDSDEQE